MSKQQHDVGALLKRAATSKEHAKEALATLARLDLRRHKPAVVQSTWLELTKHLVAHGMVCFSTLSLRDVGAE